jgi:hypothetical protein
VKKLERERERECRLLTSEEEEEEEEDDKKGSLWTCF